MVLLYCVSLGSEQVPLVPVVVNLKVQRNDRDLGLWDLAYVGYRNVYQEGRVDGKESGLHDSEELHVQFFTYVKVSTPEGSAHLLRDSVEYGLGGNIMVGPLLVGQRKLDLL